MTEATDRDNLIELIAWWSELGVDAVVADEPVDWRARGETPPGAEIRAAMRGAPTSPTAGMPAAVAPKAPPVKGLAGDDPPRSRARPPSSAPNSPETSAPRAEAPPAIHRARPAALAPDDSVMAARRAAASAATLDVLTAALAAFEGCTLKATAKSTCVYRGAPRARLMIIGEAPGRDEDVEGRPFVGRAGKLLDRMLSAIGLGEQDVHITNIVYWRPPGNRTPTPQEAQVCRPFLERQIALVAPDIVLPLGGPAAKAILDADDGIMRLRGKWRTVEIGGHRARALASLHPAYLLRQPAAKRLAWRDLLGISRALAEKL